MPVGGFISGRQLMAAVTKAGIVGTRKSLKELKALTKSRTPVETGAMRDGIDDTPVTSNGTVIKGRVRTTGDRPDGTPVNSYAVFPHERMELHHPVGEAKFLEKSALEMRGPHLQNLGDELRKITG